MFSRLTAPIAAFVVLVVLALPNVGAAQMVPPPPSEEKDAGTADATPPASTAGLESPRATVTTFEEAMAGDDPTTAATAFGRDALPATDAVRSRTLQTFASILGYLGWRDADQRLTLPDTTGDLDETIALFPWRGRAIDPPTVRSAPLAEALANDWRIELRRDADAAWRFTAESITPDRLDEAIAAINRIRRARGGAELESESFDEWIALHAPPWMLETFLGMTIWQWFALGAVILAGLAADIVVRVLTIGFVRRLTRRLHPEVDDTSVRRTVRGLGIVGTTLVWLAGLSLLGLPLAAFSILEPAARFALVLSIFWLGWRATDLVGEVIGARATRTDTRLDDILVPMIRKTIKVLLVVFAMLNLAPMLGLNLGPLLAAIGVGSFGFAFAFKNSLENLFGSVTVILDRPFQVGDWIVIDGVEGTVETVGLRSTRIRTFYNSLVTMPNANLITNKVDNYGMRKYRRWSTKVGILYGTPVARIDAFCEAIRELVREHPYTRKDYYQVWLNGFGDSALEVLVYVFWEAPDWQTELRERHRLMLDIIRVADELGIDFAFPSRTLYLQRGTPPGTPRDAGLDDADPRAAMRTGRTAVRTVVEGADWREEIPPKYRFLTAEETERIDRIDDEERAAEVERRLEQRERTDLPSQDGDDPDRADFTEQRDAGG
jgi:MscS family membrane protein